MKAGPESIKKLIQELQKDDEDVEHENEVTIPEKAIAKLINMGAPAIAHLLPLLDYPNRYSCAYAVEILAEIGDKRAMQALVKLEVDEDFADLAEYFEYFKRPIYYDKLRSALEKMGPDVIETLLQLAEKVPDHCSLSCTIAEIGSKFHDERAFQYTLKRAKPTDDMYDIEEYVDNLLFFRDVRAIPVLTSLMGKDLRNNEMVLGALSEICDTESYRQILIASAQDTIQAKRRQVTSAVENLDAAYKYPDKFEGERSQEWDRYTRERKIRESVEALIRSTATLSKIEGVIPKEGENGLIDVADKIHKEIEELPTRLGLPPKVAETIGCKYYPMGKNKEERQYRGLNSVKDQIVTSTVEWLKAKDFKTLVKDAHTVWGWKEDRELKISGVFMEAVYNVRVQDWGEGWKEDEAKSFLTELLARIDEAARERGVLHLLDKDDGMGSRIGASMLRQYRQIDNRVLTVSAEPNWMLQRIYPGLRNVT